MHAKEEVVDVLPGDENFELLYVDVLSVQECSQI